LKSSGIKVAVAVIIDDKQRVLITKRPSHVMHGGQWEFPGGKLEKDEKPISALIREIDEEVGLYVEQADFLCHINFHYDIKEVDLFVYCVTQFSGQAQCCEAQTDLRWVTINELSGYQFPAANNEIIRQLGYRYLNI
jgi:8-oxo-dGTP diphosphatase